MRGRFPISSVRVIFPQSIAALLLLPVCFGVGASLGVRIGHAFVEPGDAPSEQKGRVDTLAGAEAEAGVEGALAAGSLDHDQTFTDLPEPYRLCQDEAEKAARIRQAACLAAPLKASSHWLSFEQAETETIDLLQAGDFDGIGKYIACDAVDLTMYEAHCDSDLNSVDQRNIEQVLEFVEPRVLAAAQWSREESSSRQLMRSRLVSPYMTLGPPWSPEQQPSEGKTLLLLERQKDGRIYVSGVPITGVEATRAKPLD
jgi:hypothetical protein